MISVIADAINRLDDLRKNREIWAKCAYRQTVDEERGSHDANERERQRFLIALQYNSTPLMEI